MKNLIVGLKGTLKSAERVISEPIHPLYEVFIAPPPEISGNGRVGVPQTNIDIISSTISLAAKRGTRVNVILNSVTTQPTPEVERFVVANERMVEFLSGKRNRENLQFGIVLSTFMYIATLDRVKKYQENLSVEDRIIIHQDCNRKFGLLEKMEKESMIPLELFANPICLQDCPDNPRNHPLFLSQNSNRNVKDEYILGCIQRRINDPSLILPAPIIRPEDLSIYERMGFKFFKLGTRTFPTDQTLKLIHAYQEGSFSGDIGEITGANNLRITEIHPVPNKALDGMVRELARGKDKTQVYAKYRKEVEAYGNTRKDK